MNNTNRGLSVFSDQVWTSVSVNVKKLNQDRKCIFQVFSNGVSSNLFFQILLNKLPRGDLIDINLLNRELKKTSVELSVLILSAVMVFSLNRLSLFPSEVDN